MTKEKGVISVGKKTFLTLAVLLLLVGGFFAWYFLKPEPPPKKVLFSYLRQKTLLKAWPVSENLRQSPTPWTELARVLDSANDYHTMYRAIAEQLTLADQLLTNQAQQATGLRIAIEASRGALNVTEDGWLATRICEAFLLPNLKLADTKGGVGPTRDQIIIQTVKAVQTSGDFEGQVAYYRKLLKREATVHEYDWARAQCANVLYKIGKQEDAATLLQEIKDPSTIGKKGSKQVSKLQKKIAKTQPPAAVTNTTKAGR
jgi:hypothetical protein